MGRVRIIVDNPNVATSAMEYAIKNAPLPEEWPEDSEVYVVPDDEEWPSLD